ADVLATLPQDKLAGLRLTHPHRIMYPAWGTTKLDLVTYYAQSAARMLPHLRQRPLSLYRCPEGVDGAGFFQKQPPAGLPDSVERVELTGDDEPRQVMIIDDVAGLLALVQFSVLEFHIGGSRLDRLDRPDQIVFDLDPDPAVDWETVRAASVEVRQRLEALGLVSFVKTSGGKGLHVVVPIKRRNSWDEVFEFSKGIAKQLARERLSRFVATVSKSARRGKIYIDYLRNKPVATAIAPWSTRARSTGAIAMPITWEELARVTAPDQWTVANVASRIASDQADAWEGFFEVNQSITKKMWQSL
ncbi:MAG: non-homologous end-joining DNA ligase, partial [Planctomycetota bacterium]